MGPTFEHLHQDPETWGGAWVFKGTRVPAFIVRDFFAAHGRQETLAGYPGVSPEALDEALAADWLTFEPDRERNEAAWDSLHAANNFDANRFRSALQRIASADLKRCSAGWLQQIAMEALGEKE